MHYLDELCLYPVPTSKETRIEAKIKVQDRFQHGDLSGSLEDAFKIWDAVSLTDVLVRCMQIVR